MGRTKPKKSKDKKKPKKDKKPKGPPQAESADKYVLYQRAVQEPDADLDFFDQTFKEIYGRTPTRMREDFCGTHAAACRWVARRPENLCWGVDLDPEPLAWGREHNQAALSDDEKARLVLFEGDVREVREEKVEVIAAQNFSYCVFKERDALRAYFAACRQGLEDEGILVLDLFGGPESQQPAEDETVYSKERFSYIWDQQHYDAITNEIRCAIHFKFRDGSALREAFVYDWRLWTIAELREILVEAGFKEAHAYWEGVDEDGDGDGEFVKTANAEQEDAWIAYVVASV